MRKSIKLLGALGVAGLVAAGGSAYTDSNTQAATQVVGYGSTTISGATVNSMTYTLNPAGDNVNSVTLKLAADTHLSAVSIGFNGGQTTSCGAGSVTATVPAVSADPEAQPPVLAADAVPGFTTYTCKNGDLDFTQAPADLTSTAVIVN